MVVKMPGATWRPLSHGVGGKRSRTDAVIFHVAVTNADDIHHIFNRKDAGASCHLYVNLRGEVIQYADLDRITWTSGEANDRSIGVETAGMGDGEWNPAQLKACAAIAKFVHEHYGVPLRLMQSSRSSEKGVGSHRLGCDGNFPAYPSIQAGRSQRQAALGGSHEVWSKARGKECPGNGRQAQMPLIVELAGGDRTKLPKPKPVTLQTLPVLRFGDVGPAVKVLQTTLGVTADGEFGHGTRNVVGAFQQSKGLTVDYVVGPATKAALVEATASKAKPVVAADPTPQPERKDDGMGKRLYSGNPNSGVLGTRTSYAQLKACAEELDALGFMVRENLHFGDKVLDRNAHSSNSLHYCYSGTGAIDVNWASGGRDELIMISMYAIPIARKHGLKGAVHRPRRALLGTHNTWIHIDRSGWWDANGISLSSADKARGRALAAKHGKSGGSSARSGSSNTSSLDKYPRYGDKGKYVKDLQKKLWFLGYSKTLGKIDSQFGAATSKALKAYQKREGLKADGIAGPNTWSHLNADVKAKMGSKKSSIDVSANKGLVVDGHFGPQSWRALARSLGMSTKSSKTAVIKKLQYTFKTTQDGVVTPSPGRSSLAVAVQRYLNKPFFDADLSVDGRGLFESGSNTTVKVQSYLKRGGKWAGAPRPPK